MKRLGPALAKTTISVVSISILFLSACFYSAQPARRVTRVNANAQTDLTGKWNDTDANIVARHLVKSCLRHPWAKSFRSKTGRLPVIKLDLVRNRTSEYEVKPKFFTKQIERELINSGIVKVVAGYDETGRARREKDDQSKHSSDATKKEHQQETGADFLLNGYVVSQIQRAGGTSVKAYMVTLELTSVQGQNKVGTGFKKSKKVVTQAPSQW